MNASNPDYFTENNPGTAASAAPDAQVRILKGPCFKIKAFLQSGI